MHPLTEGPSELMKLLNKKRGDKNLKKGDWNLKKVGKNLKATNAGEINFNFELLAIGYFL